MVHSPVENCSSVFLGLDLDYFPNITNGQHSIWLRIPAIVSISMVCPTFSENPLLASIVLRAAPVPVRCRLLSTRMLQTARNRRQYLKLKATHKEG